MEDGVGEAESFLREREIAGEEEDEQKSKRARPSEASEEKGTAVGILDNLISSLVGPRTPEDGGGDAEEPPEAVESGGGGVTGDEMPEVVQVGRGDGEENDKEAEEEERGGGMFDKILSHLPGDAVPATEEASILIHSVID